MALHQADAERTVKRPQTDIDKLKKYCDAVKKAKQFFTPDIGKLSYDPYDSLYSYHVVNVILDQDEFEGDEVTTLTEIISQFDSLMIVSTTSNGIILQMIMNDIYTEAKGT